MKNYKRRSLFFPFGIITLTLLPIIGFQKITLKESKENVAPQHCLEIVISPSQKYDDEMFTIEKVINLRTYKSFFLTADKLKNKTILSQARLLYNQIKTNKDTLNGVRISFNDSTKYQDFITALDYCNEKWPHTFGVNGSDIWALYDNVENPKEKKK